jgi:hypothetical protein
MHRFPQEPHQKGSLLRVGILIVCFPSERHEFWTSDLSIALMMQAMSTSEISVSFYETTRRNILEGCHRLIYRLFPPKRHESWTHVILQLGLGLGFDHKEITETYSKLNWSPQQ